MNSRVRADSCPPDFELERVVAKETVPELVAHLSSCESCRGYIATLSEAAEQFRRMHPSSRMIAKMEKQSLSTPEKRRWWVPLSGLSLAAASVLAFVLLRPPTPEVTFKGSLLSIAVKRGEEVSLISEKETLHGGDALRFRISAPQDGYAVVLERDADGNVTVVAPFGSTTPQAVKAGTSVLPDSAVLDSKDGKLSYFAIFSPTAFDVISVVRQTQKGVSPSCDSCLVQTSTFEKSP